MVVGRGSYGSGEGLMWWWGGADVVLGRVHMVVGRGADGGGEGLIWWWGRG